MIICITSFKDNSTNKWSLDENDGKLMHEQDETNYDNKKINIFR